VEAGGGIDVLGARLPLPTGLAAGTRVDVAARPQAVSVSTHPGALSVAGRLTHIENLGSDLFLHAAVEGAPAPIVVRHDPALANAPGLGDAVAIDLPAARLLVFDSAGRRVALKAAAVAARHAHA
jgi:multiple sugar transport system ATP-binding protein